jgi:hypothetical protein
LNASTSSSSSPSKLSKTSARRGASRAILAALLRHRGHPVAGLIGDCAVGTVALEEPDGGEVAQRMQALAFLEPYCRERRIHEPAHGTLVERLAVPLPSECILRGPHPRVLLAAGKVG